MKIDYPPWLLAPEDGEPREGKAATPSLPASPVPHAGASGGFRDAILRKCEESVEAKRWFFTTYAGKLEALARVMGGRFGAGRKLFTAGSGGSLADALHCALEFTHPVVETRQAFPVLPLVTDLAAITTLGAEPDHGQVFVEQLRLQARAGDMFLAVCSNGKSPSLIRALEEARQLGLLTIAWSGGDGGRFPELADYNLVVPSYSIHRIEEVHATLVHVLWDLIHLTLGADDVI